jgi:hypothetical protein
MDDHSQFLAAQRSLALTGRQRPDLLQNPVARPMTTTITPTQELSPEGRAVLALVLSRGKSYAEIGELLRMDPRYVRTRAHLAADRLAADPSGRLTPLARARIVDYLLGEQSVSQRARTRAELIGSAAQREYATALARALEPIAGNALPAVPGDEEGAAGTTAVAEREAERALRREGGRERERPAVREGGRPPPPGRDGGRAAAREAKRALPPAPPRTYAPAGRTSLRLELEAPGRGRGLRWLAVGSLVLAMAAVVASVIAIVDGSGSSAGARSPRRAAARSHGAAPAQAVAKSIRRLILAPAGTERNASAAGTVARQGGQTLLLLQGRGLAPNRGNSYAVWLYNSAGDARLLGFVSPAVGADGTFSSGASLPGDAVRFHMLLITLEQASQPTTPGQPVLRGPLSLP